MWYFQPMILKFDCQEWAFCFADFSRLSLWLYGTRENVFSYLGSITKLARRARIYWRALFFDWCNACIYIIQCLISNISDSSSNLPDYLDSVFENLLKLPFFRFLKIFTSTGSFTSYHKGPWRIRWRWCCWETIRVILAGTFNMLQIVEECRKFVRNLFSESSSCSEM